MEQIFDKISEYNIINYIFPGSVFALLIRKIGTINLIQEDMLLGIFFYYFIGLIISRIGSVIIEPIFRSLKIIIYRDYTLFLNASRRDKKIDVLVEINNMYRTLVSLFLLLSIYKGVILILKKFNINSEEAIEFIIMVGLLILFICSFRKQTAYIASRIDNSTNKK